MNLDKIENHALRLRVKTLLQCLESEGREKPWLDDSCGVLKWRTFDIDFGSGRSAVLFLKKRVTLCEPKGPGRYEQEQAIPLDMHPKQPMYWVQEALRLAPKLLRSSGDGVTWEHKRYTDREVGEEYTKTGMLPDAMTVYVGCDCGWWWVGPKFAFVERDHPGSPKHACVGKPLKAKSGGEAEAIRKAADLMRDTGQRTTWNDASCYIERFPIRFPITMQIEPVKPKVKVGDTVEVGSLPVGTTVAFHGCKWKIWSGSQCRTDEKVELRSDRLGAGWEPHRTMCQVVSLPNAY